MRTPFTVITLTLLALAAPRPAAAQDLVIVNARILDGKGGVIDRGSVVVQGGKIVSVAPGAPASAPGATRIDAQGRTLMPGFIDAHRHIAEGNPAEWLATRAAPQMQGPSRKIRTRRPRSEVTSIAYWGLTGFTLATP